ncbi:MAG: molecular chaperone DnaJ [Nanoarchaeota archaeon]
MAKKDYYETLGVNRNASHEEIKKAFKQLARKWHPDVHQDKKQAEEKFKEINEAFQVLNDPGKRQQYDQFGTADFNGQGYSQGFDFNDIFRSFGFEDLFGGFNKREREENYDIRINLELSLEEAFSGVKKNIEVPQFVSCTVCKGSGAKDGFLNKCGDCEGTGQQKKIHRTFFGQVVSVATCGKCYGKGKIIAKQCGKCDEGRVKKIKKIEVDIPKGVDNEQYIRIPFEFGNVYVVIHVLRHELFERSEENLFCKTVLDLGTAVLGGEVEIPTISGKAKVKIPSGTQSHIVFRLKGQGMPVLNSDKRGDQLVKFVVEIPEKLTKKQLELIKEAFSKDSKAETEKGFFEKLREYV